MSPKQIDKLLLILDRFVSVAERWADREYPNPGDSGPVEIYRQGQPDEPDSRESYDHLPEGRFEKKFREAHPEA